MINSRLLLPFFIIFSLLAVEISAQPSVPVSATPMMPLSDVREGMNGIAKTVFRGTQPEAFNVEILGIVPDGIGPRQDLIVGRISGGGADRTAVFAGMSGSPVYIGGKLIGAISYSFPFAKEAICGITPIEQMISIFRGGNASALRPMPVSVSPAEIERSIWQPAGMNGPSVGTIAAAHIPSIAGQTFQRIATPVSLAGFDPATIDRFGEQLKAAGLMTVAAAGARAPITPMKKADSTTLQGGTSVSMQLTRGDYSMAAAGTVTLRDGDNIYAFGHPFLSLGTSDLPMSESHVVTVVPNLNNSFKLAVADDLVGSMTDDLATGVFGKLGRAPRMIPVRVNATSSRGQTEVLNFEVARDEFLTPLLLNITVFNSAVARERSIGDAMVGLSGTIKLKNGNTILIDRRFSGSQATVQAAGAVSMPANILLRTRFPGLDIERIDVDLTTAEGSRTAAIERLEADRTEVRAGETIALQAFIRTTAGALVSRTIPFTIPNEAAAGKYSISVGDGASLQRNAASQHFVPNTPAELVELLNGIKTSDKLFVKLERSTSGVISGSNEMPDLPPSVLATMNSSRSTGGMRPLTSTAVTEKLLPRDEYIVIGQQTLSIEVVR